MTVPTQNTQIVGQGLARLTSAFITQPNVRAILQVYLQPAQELENALWGIITGRVLSTATIYSPTSTIGPKSNAVFDAIGALVGLSREFDVTGTPSIPDVEFKTMIYLEVAVNRATGRTTDWSGFAAILAPWNGGVVYLDGDNADFWFGTWSLVLPPAVVAGQLARAVPNGIYCCFLCTEWADGNDFSFTSVTDGTAGEAGFGSVTDSTAGGILTEAFPLAGP